MKTRTKLIIAGAAIVAIVAGVLIVRHFISINKGNQSVAIIGGADGPTAVFLAGKLPGSIKQTGYVSISMEEAKEIFATPGDYTILDVRTAFEFEKGHIPGAINIANGDIGSEKPAELPDLDRVIYVYCLSGHRSKKAASKLAALGYTNIYEIGGIWSWDGEIEK